MCKIVNIFNDYDWTYYIGSSVFFVKNIEYFGSFTGKEVCRYSKTFSINQLGTLT